MMKANFTQQNTKRVIAGLLSVWLSGVMFLFCCESMQAKISESESCPLAKTNHCHKIPTGETASKLASFQTENQTVSCCAFAAQVFDKARKLETNRQAAQAAESVKLSTPKFFPVRREFSRPKIYRSAVFNRGSTHLVNCVFRI